MLEGGMLSDLVDALQDAFCPSYPSSVKHEARLLVLAASPFSGCLALGASLLLGGSEPELARRVLQLFYVAAMVAAGRWFWKDRQWPTWVRMDPVLSNKITEAVCFGSIILYVLPCLLVGDVSNWADMLVVAGLGFLLLYLPCLDQPFLLCLLFGSSALVGLGRLPFAEWQEWRNIFFCAVHLAYFALVSYVARSRMQRMARQLQSPLRTGAANILTRFRRRPAEPDVKAPKGLQGAAWKDPDGHDAATTGSDIDENEDEMDIYNRTPCRAAR